MANTINFSIPQAKIETAKKYAEERGYTLSTLCRVALLEKIKNKDEETKV